ncbi:hypothetical protein ACIPSH_20185 [Streptomyces iakyrus]|uniref:hypothetical protein n=1 Tax=Streptomyces iakyrus TaxID=68219 RepID=UPI003815E872
MTFDQVMDRIAGRFGRVEPRASARAHLLGLPSNPKRKNCWQLAEQAGHVRPAPMQRLLRYARWDADAVRDDLRSSAAERLGTDAWAACPTGGSRHRLCHGRRPLDTGADQFRPHPVADRLPATA